MLRRLIYCGECGSLVMPAWTNNHGREYRFYEEQSRVLELLVESVAVSKHSVDFHFRANGIEQIVGELTPMRERTDG